MNIKILLVFWVCYFFYYPITISQIIEIKRSRTIEIGKKNLIREGIAASQHGYYLIEMIDVKINKLLKTAKGKYRLLYFNEELDLIKTKDTEIKLKNDISKIEYFTIFKEELLVFASTIDKASKKKYLHLYRYDSETLNKTQDPKKIYESSYVGFYRNNYKFGFSISPNKSKILVYELNPIKKSNRELGICVLNKKAEKLWEKTILLEKFKRRDTKIRRGIIDNNGNAFFLKKSFFNLNFNFEHPFNHNKPTYKLFAFDATTQYHSTSIINPGTNYITDIDLELLINGSPFMLGYYSDKSESYTQGVVQIIGTQKGESLKLKKSFQPFSNEILALNHKKKPREGKTKKMKKFMVKKIFQQPNKSLTIIGERLYLDTYSKGSGSSKREIKKMVHESILISNHGAEDEKINFANKVAKHGDSKVERFINFYSHRKGNEVFFIYNDHPDNMGYPGYGKIAKADGQIFKKKSQISVTHISDDGEANTTPLFPKSIERRQGFYPRSSLQISENEMLIIERVEKEFELVKLKVEE